MDDDSETPVALESQESGLLRQLYAFGFERIPGKKKQFVCIDDSTLAYALGCNVVIHRLNSKRMHFVALNAAVERIVAVTSSLSGRLLAACLKMKSGPGQIAVIDTNKQKAVMCLTATSSAELEVCALSRNEERAVAVTKNNKGCVICWELLHGKVLNSIPIFVEITGITMNPKDDDEFATCGPSHFRVWSLKGGQTKSYALKGLDFKNLTLTDHDWLEDGGIVITTAESGILIVRAGELQNKLEDAGSTLCVVATSAGFLSGGADGSLKEYKAIGRPPVYSGAQLTNLGGPVTWLALPPNVEAVAYAQQDDKLLRLDYADFESEGSEDVLDLHVMDLAAISGMDICVRRRLIATCSTNKVVRLWNYSRILCELTHICDEQPTSIAISPWGYDLLVGMACTSITIFGIMANRLEPRKELALQGCGQMKYSPCGSIVAVLCGREIVLYSSFTWEVLAVLKGHIGKVTSISWSHNSLYLASAGADGALYAWSMDDFKRHEECVTKGSQYSCVLYDVSRTFLYSCGPHFPLRIVSTSNKPPPDALKLFPPNVTIGVYDFGRDAVYRGSILCDLHDLPHYCQLVGFFHKRLVFGISEAQALHAYAYPLSINTTGPMSKFSSQAGRVAGLCIDEKHNLIFVYTTVGTIFICTFDGGPQCLAEMFAGDTSDEEEIISWLLVKRAELDQFQQELQDLKSSLQAEQDESRYRQHRIRQDWTEKLSEQEKESAKKERQLCQEIQVQKEKLESAEKSMEHMTQNFLQGQSLETASLYEHFEEKFTGETARAEHWRSKAEKVKEESLEQLALQKESHAAQTLVLEERMRVMEDQAAEKLLKVRAECEKDVLRYKTYMEEDFMINDEELVAGLSQMKQELQNHQKLLEETRAQLLLEKKTVTSCQMQISDLENLCSAQESSIRSLEAERSKLRISAVEFEHKNLALDSLVEEADEQRRELLQSTKERETLTVLQHAKIQQLMENEKPLVAEIAHLKAKIEEVQRREELNNKQRLEQEEIERLLRERILDMEQKRVKLLDQLHQREGFLNAFKEALCTIVYDHQPAEWPPLTKGLFLAYVKESERAAVAEGLESRSQILRQRQILEDFVVVLKNTVDRTKGRSKEQAQYFVKENLNLLRDFSETNRNVRRMALIVQKLQQQVAYFKSIVWMQKRSLVKVRKAQTQSRRPITDVARRRASGSFITTGIQREIRASQEENELKLVPMRAPTPLAEIIKPYSRFSIIHGGRGDSTRTMTTSQIDRRMSHPWASSKKKTSSSSTGAKITPAGASALRVEVLTKELKEAKAECGKKQAEIASLEEALKRKSSGSRRPKSSFGPRTVGLPF